MYVRTAYVSLGFGDYNTGLASEMYGANAGVIVCNVSYNAHVGWGCGMLYGFRTDQGWG